MFFKKYSIKLRLLSRTWPNISKLEHTVLILRPSMFIAAVVKQLVPASLNAWRHRTASVQKGTNGWKWPKPKKHWKKQKNKKIIKQFPESLGWDPPLPKSLAICFLFFQGFTSFQRVLAGTPPSRESRNIVVFVFLVFCFVFGFFQGF